MKQPKSRVKEKQSLPANPILIIGEKVSTRNAKYCESYKKQLDQICEYQTNYRMKK